MNPATFKVYFSLFLMGKSLDSIFILKIYLFALWLKEAFFTKSIGRHTATGYIEERLRNVRRRMPEASGRSNQKSKLRVEEEEVGESSESNTPSKGIDVMYTIYCLLYHRMYYLLIEIYFNEVLLEPVIMVMLHWLIMSHLRVIACLSSVMWTYSGS